MELYRKRIDRTLDPSDAFDALLRDEAIERELQLLNAERGELFLRVGSGNSAAMPYAGYFANGICSKRGLRAEQRVFWLLIHCFSRIQTSMRLPRWPIFRR